jgi:transposase
MPFGQMAINIYSKTLNESAVKDYLAGLGSQDDITKYQILSKSKLQKWIKMYNNHEELKSSGTEGKRIMYRGRTTTFGERVSVVEDCIANDHNYTVVAKKHKVSYQKIYTWMKKYEKSGIETLKDHKGRTKPVEERSELEKLRYENRMLKAEKLQQQMKIDF